MKNSKQDTIVNIAEEQTIVELSQKIQGYDAEIFIKKVMRGSPIEVNLKSFLGLITLHLENGDRITIHVVGEDSEEALKAVVDYLA